MNLVNDLLSTLPDGKVVDVRIGLHWTVVVVDVNGKIQCGLASTLIPNNPHTGEPDVADAGRMDKLSGRELAQLSLSGKYPLTSVGIAAINALLPEQPELWEDKNASEVIINHGIGKNVALIGHFPFIPEVRKRVGSLTVVEKTPQEGEVEANDADKVLPNSDVVAMTAMTLVNNTFNDLIKLCSPDAFVLLLGPSTPLSPITYDYGINIISGSYVTNLDGVLKTASQGGNFRQVHRAGVRLVSMGPK